MRKVASTSPLRLVQIDKMLWEESPPNVPLVGKDEFKWSITMVPLLEDVRLFSSYDFHGQNDNIKVPA